MIYVFASNFQQNHRWNSLTSLPGNLWLIIIYYLLNCLVIKSNCVHSLTMENLLKLLAIHLCNTQICSNPKVFLKALNAKLKSLHQKKSMLIHFPGCWVMPWITTSEGCDCLSACDPLHYPASYPRNKLHPTTADWKAYWLYALHSQAMVDRTAVTINSLTAILTVLLYCHSFIDFFFFHVIFFVWVILRSCDINLSTTQFSEQYSVIWI